MSNKLNKDSGAIGVLDYNNTSTTIKVGFSGAGLDSSSAKYLAAYSFDSNDKPIIKDLAFGVFKSMLGSMPPTDHSHSYLPLSGGTMTGGIYFNTFGACSISAGDGDTDGSAASDYKTNLWINSWNSVGFRNNCADAASQDVKVSIDCRGGNVHAKGSYFEGGTSLSNKYALLGHEHSAKTHVRVHPDYSGNSLYLGWTGSSIICRVDWTDFSLLRGEVSGSTLTLYM